MTAHSGDGSFDLETLEEAKELVTEYYNSSDCDIESCLIFEYDEATNTPINLWDADDVNNLVRCDDEEMRRLWR